MDLPLSGKIALVTGSSRGIGAAIAEALDAQGARCIINYVTDPAGINESEARAVAAKLKDPLILQADVSNESQVAGMFDEIQRTLGGLDILVNNAGILRDRTIKNMTPADWNAVLNVNLSGAFHCIHHAQPLLRPHGRIVNISSVAAQVGFFGQANYAAAKAGLLGLTRVAAREFAKQQTTVNAVAPGLIETEMTKNMPPEATAKFLAQIPLARAGQIADIVNAVQFLVSPASSYITGQVLNVNGGFFVG